VFDPVYLKLDTPLKFSGDVESMLQIRQHETVQPVEVVSGPPLLVEMRRSLEPRAALLESTRPVWASIRTESVRFGFPKWLSDCPLLRLEGMTVGQLVRLYSAFYGLDHGGRYLALTIHQLPDAKIAELE